MDRKLVLIAIMAILLTSLLGVPFRVEKVKASGIIYIRVDGSIDPPTANITTVDSVTYTFTDNNYDEIVVEKDNILLDEQGYLLQGTGSGTGILLSSGRSNVTLRNIEIKAFEVGVRLNSSSSYNTVSGNNITSNNWWGVYLDSSFNNTVSGNHITNNTVYGVILWDFSNYNTVSGNHITGNGDGVHLDSSSFNIILGNNITANAYTGVYFYSPFHPNSTNYNTVSGNHITNNEFGVWLSSSSYNNTISRNNITNNDYGVCLWDSSNYNTVSGNHITNNTWYGVGLDSSSFNIISGNNITDNGGDGVFLRDSSHYNTILGNNITANGYTGVWLSDSYSNIISGNNITSNNDYGVCLWSSYGNIISSNNIANNNSYGFWLYYSLFNIIYHNNIVANNLTVMLIDSIDNTWDNGCEGNFWSNFSGSDLNGDGIGDTPYIIDGNITDNYPLMNPYWNPSDINHDLIVDIFDVVRAAGAYDSTPSDINWNPHSDIAEPFGVIDIFDIVAIASAYGETFGAPPP